MSPEKGKGREWSQMGLSAQSPEYLSGESWVGLGWCIECAVAHGEGFFFTVRGENSSFGTFSGYFSWPKSRKF